MTIRHKNPKSQAKAASVVLDFPPAYLASVPDDVLTPRLENRRFAADLMGWLAAHAISARPSLAEIEAERARRGHRPGLTLGRSCLLRAVHPMNVSVELPTTTEREAARARGREAVARVRARFDDAIDVLTFGKSMRLLCEEWNEAA